jgi:ElaB/YqjD/DUF883 family membrane-anchored ribosome-binding protein
MANPTTPVRRPYGHNPYPDTAEDSDDPAVLRRQIEQTRANMTETVNSIQARLSPEQLKAQAQEMVRDATIGKVEEMAYTAKRSANSWRTNLVETVKRNPVPAALVGIGLGWLLMEGSGETEEVQYQYYPQSYRAGGTNYRAGSGYGYQERGAVEEARDRAREMVGDVKERTSDVKERAGEIVDSVQDRASDAVDTVQERASEVVSEVQQTVSDVTSQARERAQHLAHQAERQTAEMREWAQYEARQAKYGFQQMLQENPLAVGAAAIAIGAAIGMALPSTQAEDEWMGETRDRLVYQAQETAQETMQKVKNVAGEVQHAVKEEVTRAAENEDLPLPTGKPQRENW